ncbi:peptide/nickel transport system substrate-binding protein [Aquamicrobium lusatiense]|uniref:Peptide/nickel transport system substrate-binding protein n=1 Tax=Aquamicrobium lusatiense TaxID=89772 RepID=A0A7W9S625_9HYPH|nr:ABC transporter substrate-binding protein [Aquamicrobium lusatiense]MBB6014720.1 peptide/nickel transport system substrate-binding protein [Aquamicrobium lusatiense]
MTRNFWMGCIAAGAVLAAPAAFASEIKVANVGDMRSAIPAGATDPGTQVPQVQIYEGLLTWREDGSVAPMLAADMPEISGDGLTYVFTLREGLSFHDDTPVTATSVAKTWNWYLNAENAWVCRAYFDGSGQVKIESVEALSDLQVSFMLAHPAPQLLTQMARTDCQEGAIMAESMVDSPERPTVPVGTGPFKVEDIRPGQEIVLTRFDKYKSRSEPTDGFAGKKEALVDKIRLVIIPDPAATSGALLAGNIDLWPRIDLSYAQALAAAPGLTVDSSATPSIYTLAIQTKAGALQNPALRRAVNYAIDRKAMVEALTENMATASSTIVPASSQFYRGTVENGFDYNPEKVAELLVEADYQGEPIVITTNKNYPMMFETGVMVQGYLQAASINAQLDIADFATQFSRYNTGNYEMATWNYNPSADPSLVIDRFTGAKDTQASKLWTNPEARALTDQLLRTPIAEQQPIYDALHEMFIQDAPMIVWGTGEVTSAYKSSLKGYAAWTGRLPRLWGVSLQ